MPNLEELEREVFETEGKAFALREALQDNRVADLTGLITAAGKLKGELKGITPRQFKEIIGREPRPSIVMVAKDETQKKIPYELVLDQLMSERGFNDIEKFKDAIEAAHKDKTELEGLWRDRDILINDITAELKRGTLKSETMVVQRELPIFTESKGPATIKKINGASATSRRQHSFWRIDVDLDGDGKVDKSFRIRYAADAKKIVNNAIKQSRIMLERKQQQQLTFTKRPPKLRVALSRKQPRITPKTPRLNR